MNDRCTGILAFGCNDPAIIHVLELVHLAPADEEGLTAGQLPLHSVDREDKDTRFNTLPPGVLVVRGARRDPARSQ